MERGLEHLAKEIERLENETIQLAGHLFYQTGGENWYSKLVIGAITAVIFLVILTFLLSLIILAFRENRNAK